MFPSIWNILSHPFSLANLIQLPALSIDTTHAVDPVLTPLPPTRCPHLPHSSADKESAYSAGDLGLIPGLGRSPGEGNGNPLQDSCLENPMDREAWQAVCAVAELDMT